MKVPANVNTLEEASGWTITSVADSSLTMTYNRTLQLFFTPASFAMKDGSQTKSENSPISLTYIADAHEYHPQPVTTEKRFFLQIMRARLQCLHQSQTSVKDLLNFVSSSWDAASTIIGEAHILGVSYVTEPTITSDEAMAIGSFILLRAMRTKVQVSFEVKVRSGEGVAALGIEVKANAKVFYGENLKEKNMADFLESRIKGVDGPGAWAAAVGELEEKLIARGKKS